jgi:hypothetical protein
MNHINCQKTYVTQTTGSGIETWSFPSMAHARREPLIGNNSIVSDCKPGFHVKRGSDGQPGLLIGTRMPVKHPKPRKTTYGPHKDIQKAINQAILATDYQPPLPDLDYETWRKAFDWNGKRSKARNNILEWVGDRWVIPSHQSVHCRLKRSINQA